MGIKLGPKLELSFWSIGYIVGAVGLLIFNISWIAGSIKGVLLGIKERAVFQAEISQPAEAYATAIDTLVKDPGLDNATREALEMREAKLDFGLKHVDKARALWDTISNSVNPTLAVPARISVIAIDYAATPADASPADHDKAIDAAMTALDNLAKQHPNDTDILAAKGALLMEEINTPKSGDALAQLQNILKVVQAQAETQPGLVDARRNVLLMDLAVKNTQTQTTDAETQALKDEDRQARAIAPYLTDVAKTPQVTFMDEYWKKVHENALGPATLNLINLLPGMNGPELSQLANTVAVGVVPTLDSPKGSENLQLILRVLNNAQRADLTEPMNYENIAALHTRYAMLMDQQLVKALNDLRAQNKPLPIPFGNSPDVAPEVSTPLTIEDQELGQAFLILKVGCDQAAIAQDVKARWESYRTDIALWRAALESGSARTQRLNDALQAVTQWHDFDPNNCEMMVQSAQTYKLLGRTDEQKAWLDKARAAGCRVASQQGGGNRYDFLTIFPSNPLQVGSADCIVRGQPVLVGATFLVQGYTNAVDKNTVSVKLNGNDVKTSYYDGCVYALVTPDKLSPQNSLDLTLALSPQLIKTHNASFRFEKK
ncbi:MAG: hypothetical protein ACREJ2_08865 [Planctomycetota bacterium]